MIVPKAKLRPRWGRYRAQQPSFEYHPQQIPLSPAMLSGPDTAFHTSVDLTFISKAEMKIFATQARFLTKELGSWAYIQSKSSESE